MLAIDLEPDHLRLAIVNTVLDVIAYFEYGVDRFASSEQLLSKIISASRDLMSANKTWARRIVGIGASLPGEIDIEKGISRGSTNMPNWKNVEIVKYLSKALNLPTRIERSTHLAALSDKWRRPKTRDKNIICVTLRTGVGLALLIKGTLYRGSPLSRTLPDVPMS